MERDKLEQSVNAMLMSFKIQPDISGYDYLKSAIILCYEDEWLRNNISKKVYPLIGGIYNVSPEAVERAIRTAVENCFNCGGLLEINEKCGTVVYNNKFKWTNGEAISALTQLIKIEEGRENIKKIVEDSKIIKGEKNEN